MLHKNIKLLSLFNFFTDFRLYAPVAIIYFSKVSGSYALGMSVFAIVMISSALLEIPTGVFSDMIGRKKTIILGAAAAVLSITFYAIGQSFWILAIGAMLEGLSRSFYSGNNDALLHDTLAETQEEHHYGEHLGKISAMFQAALASSALIGSLLAEWSFALIMWLSVIPQVICLIISFRLVEPNVHSERSGNVFLHLQEAYSNFLRNKKLRLLSFSSILNYGFGESAFQFQSAFYQTVWPIWAIGFARALSHTLSTASYWLSGKLIKRFGGIKILMSGLTYSNTTGIIASAFPTLLSPILIASSSMFHGVSMVAENSFMQKEFTNHQRATMGSLNSFAGSIFFGIIAVLLGLTADILSPAKAFLIIMILQLSNMFIYLKLFKHDKQNNNL
jgi:MFS family permease